MDGAILVGPDHPDPSPILQAYLGFVRERSVQADEEGVGV